MKAKIYLLITFLFGALFLTSCKKDDPAPQPASAFTADKTTAAVGEDIQFTNTSSNSTAFTWSFGDGTTSKEIAPKRSYQNSGTYLVSLISTGAGGSAIGTMEIKITPSASFTVANESQLVSLTPVKFTNTSKGDATYLWSFGNPGNSTSTEKNPSFSYLTAGTYTVTLKATSAEGQTTATKTITVTAAASEIYIIDSSAELIEKLKIDGSGTLTPALDVSGKAGVGIAYDDVHGKIYFSDFDTYPEGKIWRMNLDATGLEAIVTGIGDPYGIALDITGGKVYWTDDDGNIGRANFDGSGKENVVSGTGGQYRAIALDVANNKMYYYDAGDNEGIYSASLTGANQTPVITGVYGYALLVDTQHHKIYYDDQEAGQLSMADLDGNNQELVDDNGTRIYGMAIDYTTQKLYWSGRDSKNIMVADLDGGNQQKLNTTPLSSPRGIFLRK